MFNGQTPAQNFVFNLNPPAAQFHFNLDPDPQPGIHPWIAQLNQPVPNSNAPDDVVKRANRRILETPNPALVDTFFVNNLEGVPGLNAFGGDQETPFARARIGLPVSYTNEEGELIETERVRTNIVESNYHNALDNLPNLRVDSLNTLAQLVSGARTAVALPRTRHQTANLNNNLPAVGETALIPIQLILQRIANIIPAMGVNFRTVPEHVNLQGIYLGMLCRYLSEHNIDLTSLYLYGDVRSYSMRRVPNGNNGYTVRLISDETRLISFPLSQVEYSDEVVSLDNNILLDELFVNGANNSTFAIRYLFRELNDLKCYDPEAGSDSAINYVCMAGAYIVKRHEPIQWINNRTLGVRTGSLATIINLDCSADLYDEDITNKRLGSIIIPKGKSNCVKRAIFMALIRFTEESIPFGEWETSNPTENLDDYRKFVKDTAKEKLKEIFDNYEKSRRDSVSNFSAYYKRNVYGYSNREIKTLIEFMFLNFNILLHVLYLGKPCGNNINWQDICKTVITSKKRTSKKPQEKLFNMSLEDVSNIKHIWLIQMNDCGKIHCIDSSFQGKVKTLVSRENGNLEISKSGVKRKRTLSVSEENNEEGELVENPEYNSLENKHNNLAQVSGLLHTVYLDRCEFTAVKIRPNIQKDFTYSSFYSDILNKGKNFTYKLVRIIEKETEEIMVNIYNDTVYKPDIDNGYITDLVFTQQKRYTNKTTKTLIFDADQTVWRNVNDLPVKPQVQESLRAAMAHGSAYGVVAYDLETVQLLGDSLESSLIYPPLVEHFERMRTQKNEEIFQDLDNSEQQCITALPFEMPWSSNCVFVNVSDYGALKTRKLQTNLPVVDYKKMLAEHCRQFSIPMFGNEAISEEYPDVMFNDIILDKPQIFDGDKQYLGKCVLDMVNYIANKAYELKIKTVYCFAHNGARFDTVMLLATLPFTPSKPLKTKRGIISVTYKIPVTIPTSEANFVNVIFRDTRCWLNGSLDSICKGFKVPQKWCKLNYPIRMINKKNWNVDIVQESVGDYCLNDVLALAWIIHKYNKELCDDVFKTPTTTSLKPPICQQLTLMGNVKNSMRNYFLSQSNSLNDYYSSQPRAVDLPALRRLIIPYGGLVIPYARSFVSSEAKNIISAYLEDNTEDLKIAHALMIHKQDCICLLDKISLYPAAMYDQPSATGNIQPIESEEQAVSLINDALCEDCMKIAWLCPKHKGEKAQCTPYAFILVKNVQVPEEARMKTFVICPRKPLLSGRASTSYTLESTEELNSRLRRKIYKSDEVGEKICDGDDSESIKRLNYLRNNFIPDIQCYSNYQLAMMMNEGFTFQLVGGFYFPTSMRLRGFIEKIFEQRVIAKQEKNEVKSSLYKNKMNGAFGSSIQKDITDSYFFYEMPENLKFKSFKEKEVEQFLVYNEKVDSSECLKGMEILPSGKTLFQKEKYPHIGEYYAPQSPSQLGCSILCNSKLQMYYFMKHITPLYIDTDGVDTLQSDIEKLKKINPNLINHESSASLGCLKNDHLGSLPDSVELKRGFLSFYAGSKCKLRFMLNSLGEIEISITFKGISPVTQESSTGRKYHPDYVNYTIAKSLVDIYFYGKPEDTKVAHWYNNASHGINITEFTQIGRSESYLSKHQGCVTYDADKRLEWFVPFGSKVKCSHKFVQNSDGEYVIEDCEERIQKFKNTHGFGYEEIIAFLQKYFPARNDYYKGDEEYEKIINIFAELAN